MRRATAPTLLHTSLYFPLPAEPGVIWASDAVIDRLRVFDVCTVRDAWIQYLSLLASIHQARRGEGPITQHFVPEAATSHTTPS